MVRAALATAALFLLTSMAFAADPYGVWRRPEDGTTFNFFRCGSGLCVKVKGVTDPADRKFIGSMVFSGAQRPAPTSGKGGQEPRRQPDVHGQDHAQRINSITLDGCVMGGAICKGETWTRVR